MSRLRQKKEDAWRGYQVEFAQTSEDLQTIRDILGLMSRLNLASISSDKDLAHKLYQNARMNIQSWMRFAECKLRDRFYKW